MGFWDQVGAAPQQQTQRTVSTPSRGDWYPTPQYQPPRQQETWEQPQQQRQPSYEDEMSPEVRNFLDGEDGGTWSYNRAGSGIQGVRTNDAGEVIGNLGAGQAAPMFLREIPDGIDPGMLSMADKHEYFWQRAARSPLKGRSKALRAEPDRCPACGDARFFSRGTQTRNGYAPAPMCMACSYTGDAYEITSLN